MHVRKLAVALGATTAISALAAGQQFVQQTTALFPVQAEYSNQITSVDIDGDGDLDLVFANGQGYNTQGAALQLRIYVNRLNEPGIGRFVDESATRLAGILGWARGVEAGDVNGDGFPDLVVAQDFNKQPLLLINDGTGIFSNETAARLPALTMSSARAQFADVDNDGDLDLFFCNSGAVNRFGTGQPRLYLNDGNGFFTNVTATNIPAGNISDQQDCIFGDVDGDFDLDLVVVSRSNNATRLWLNDGNGVFTNFPITTGSGSYSYDFADIDGDGDLDLISTQGGSDLLLQNNMPAPWTNISGEISPNTAIDDNDSKFFDYDNDGDMDYVVGSLGASERVYRNNGGVASDPGPLFTQVTGIMPNFSDATLDIEVADYNDDGRLDVVTAQGEGGNFQNRIYINTTGPVDTIPPRIVAVEQVGDVRVGCEAAGPFAVRTMILDSHSSDRGFYPGPIKLSYTIDGDTVEVDMIWVGNSMWRGVIPAVSAPGTVSYRVIAEDRAGNVATSDDQMFEAIGPAVPGDLNGDGKVDGADLGLLLGGWGDAGATDVNCDGTTDGADLGVLLGSWS
ncbi:MAG TPA: VCBS repeat-containing protein [Phycisphaerales bacterium]|nr:VCBS repeat-containing protein [Phycisphaerales bacterium]HMP35807.1 VCBS repeat-containing protein [Phycisphaerales bacterium]